jgi:hypothetical protein
MPGKPTVVVVGTISFLVHTLKILKPRLYLFGRAGVRSGMGRDGVSLVVRDQKARSKAPAPRDWRAVLTIFVARGEGGEADCRRR